MSKILKELKKQIVNDEVENKMLKIIKK